ncbi:MAG: SDR family oxidoreductase [Pseudomonadota bacterium]
MRVLITGGSGFIGAWIIRRFIARNWDVRVLDVKDDRRVVRDIVGLAADLVGLRIGDVSAGDAVTDAAAGCDVIVHLAAVLTPACQADPLRGAQINLIGTLNAFLAAKRHKLRGVLYMSSAGVFGPDDGDTPFPLTHYGAFKLAGEGSARAFWEDDRLPSIGFRPLVVYGPGREVGLTAGPSIACRAAARGEPYVIPFTGETDFLHVDDIAAAFEAAALAPLTGARVFNVLGEVASVDRLIAEIRRVVPDAALSAAGPRLPVAAHIAADDLGTVLPRLPRTSLAAGVAATIAHYRQAR